MTLTSRAVAGRLRGVVEATARDVVRAETPRLAWRSVLEVMGPRAPGRGGTATVVDGLGRASFGVHWHERRPVVGDVVLVEVPPADGTRRIVAIDREIASDAGLTLPVYTLAQFGALGDGSTDDTGAINDALAYAGAHGGGHVLGAPGAVYVVTSRLDMTGSRVQLDLNGGTLLRTGSSTDPVLWIHTKGPSEYAPDGDPVKIVHCALSNGTVTGGGVAQYGIRVTTANFVVLERLYLSGATAWQVYMDCWDVRPSGGNARDNQNCNLRELQMACTGTQGGLRLEGNATPDANTSLNRYDNIVITHVNGTAFHYGNCDGNVSSHLRNFCSGTGDGLILGAGAVLNKGHARHNVFFGTQIANGSDITAKTGTQPAGPNFFFGNSTGNGGGAPVDEAGAETWYINDDGTTNLATGGGGGLTDGDYGDVAVSGTGTVLTVESASGQFAYTGTTTTDTSTGSLTAVAVTNVRYRWNGASAATIHGFAGGAAGRMILVQNMTAAQVLTLANQSATEGTATNRIVVAGSVDLKLNPGASAFLWYDAANRWRVLGLQMATALEALTTTGLIVRTGAATAAARSITVGSGLSVSDGDGVAANPLLDRAALTGDVTASAGSNATTIAARAVTAAKLFAATATSRFLLRKTASGGDWEEGTASDAKTILAIAQADVSGLTTASSPTFAGLTLNGRSIFNGQLQPAQITSNQNDYNPTGFTSAINRLEVSVDAARDITGLNAGAEGDLLLFCNRAVSGGAVTLKNNSASSTAANRFISRAGTDTSVGVQGAVLLLYNGSRWRIIGA